MQERTKQKAKDFQANNHHLKNLLIQKKLLHEIII